MPSGSEWNLWVFSWRWVWVESKSVASGCGCKEVYRFPNITYPYNIILLLYISATASLLFCSFFKVLKIKRSCCICSMS